MTTQIVEFRAVTAQTITTKLFEVGSDTEIASTIASEATNRKGTYSATYNDVPAGSYDLIAFVNTTPVARWRVALEYNSATYQAYEPINEQKIDQIQTSIETLADEILEPITTTLEVVNKIDNNLLNDIYSDAQINVIVDTITTTIAGITLVMPEQRVILAPIQKTVSTFQKAIK